MKTNTPFDKSDCLFPGLDAIPRGRIGMRVLWDQNLLSFLFRAYKVRKKQEYDVDESLQSSMKKFREIFDYTLKLDIRDMQGEGLLDLGCGSSESEDPKARGFEPWFCRALYSLGGKVAGGDIGDNSREVFPHYKLDLMDPSQLSIFRNESFQFVNTANVFGNKSPILSDKIYQRLRETISNFDNLEDDEAIQLAKKMFEKIFGEVKSHAARILMINGYFQTDETINSTVYQRIKPFDPCKNPLGEDGCLKKLV